MINKVAQLGKNIEGCQRLGLCQLELITTSPGKDQG
jgi:hypothetical protein